MTLKITNLRRLLKNQIISEDVYKRNKNNNNRNISNGI